MFYSVIEQILFSAIHPIISFNNPVILIMVYHYQNWKVIGFKISIVIRADRTL